MIIVPFTLNIASLKPGVEATGLWLCCDIREAQVALIVSCISHVSFYSTSKILNGLFAGQSCSVTIVIKAFICTLGIVDRQLKPVSA